MRVFELYFSPKDKDEVFLETFIFEPTNIYEKRLGSLYMAGELNKAMPQNTAFLKNLFSVIKKEYYGATLKKSVEASLQEALKKGNEFLSAESKKGNVGWLGNLNLTILTLKESALTFTKVGETKILLYRGQELAEISGNLDNALEPVNALHVFGNMATGKVQEGDRIIVLNKKILSAFNKTKGLFSQIVRATSEKEFKQIIKNGQAALSEVTGICFSLIVGGQKEVRQTVALHRELPKYTFKMPKVNMPQIKAPQIKVPQLKLPQLKMPQLRLPQLKLPQIRAPRFHLPHINIAAAKKPLILLATFALILMIFSSVFGGERKEELRAAQQALTEAQEKTTLAENLLILKDEDKAKALFIEALNIVSPLTKRGSPVRDEALSLQNSLEEHLK